LIDQLINQKTEMFQLL